MNAAHLVLVLVGALAWPAALVGIALTVRSCTPTAAFNRDWRRAARQVRKSINTTSRRP